MFDICLMIVVKPRSYVNFSRIENQSNVRSFFERQ